MLPVEGRRGGGGEEEGRGGGPPPASTHSEGAEAGQLERVTTIHQHQQLAENSGEFKHSFQHFYLAAIFIIFIIIKY